MTTTASAGPASTTGASTLERVISRRTVVAGAAWAAPAITLMSATPAQAAASTAPALAFVGSTGTIPAAGASSVSVQTRDAQGAVLAGQPVSLSGPQGASFDKTDGVTDGSGTFTTNVNLNRPWAAPGSTVALSAVSTSQSASESLTVLGANALAWGPGARGCTGLGFPMDTSTPTQLAFAFPSPVTQIAQGGQDFTLFLLQNGTVWGVGRNDYGQLADGTQNDVSGFPKQIVGLSNVTFVAAGWQTGYAVLADGTVRSWGVNYESALGNGTTYDTLSYSTSVVTVTGLSDVKSVSAGSWFAVALRNDGTVVGWGRNGANQLGDGTNINRPTFVTVTGATGVIQLAATDTDVNALRSDGTVVAWGGAWQGQLGNGATSGPGNATPVAIQGLSGVVRLGNWTETIYAILTDGTVRAWGNGANGALGNNTTTSSGTPVTVQGLSNVAQISCGYALLNDGSVMQWGAVPGGNALVPVSVAVPAGTAVSRLGEGMGNGSRFLITTQQSLNLTLGGSQIAAGAATSVQAKVSAGAAGVAGAAVALSATSNAALGAASGSTDSSGSFSTTVTPDAWTSPGTVLTVSGSTSSDAKTASATVLGSNMLVSGFNTQAHMGIGAWAPTWTTPGQVSQVFPSPVVQAEAGDNHTVVLLRDGTVWTAGQPAYGKLGRDTTSPSEAYFGQVPGLSNVRQIAAGWNGSYALTSDGNVWAWGWNIWGQVGDGTTTDRSRPTQVIGLPKPVTFLAGGRVNGLVILSDGTVMGWGAANGKGQLGSTGGNQSTPVVISGLSSIVQLAAGNDTHSALASDGSVWVWGANDLGQCGDGTTTNRTSVFQLTSLSNVKSIARGGDAGYVVMNDGSVQAWGSNASGQVGDGSTTNRLSPVAVTGVSKAASLSASYYNAYALLPDGTAMAWGANDTGQCGDGTTTNRPSPVAVTGLGGKVVSYISGGARSQTPFFVVGQPTLTVSVSGPVSGGSAGPVTVKAASGSSGVSGVPVVLAASSAAVLGAASGTTGASGTFVSSVTPDTWTPPGSVQGVTATSGPLSANATYTVLGANVLAWGSGGTGATGFGNQNNVLTPTQILRVFPSPVVQVAQGGSGFTLFRLADGSVWGVGANDQGQLADGTQNNVTGAPQRIAGLANTIDIAAGQQSGYAVLADGTVRSWGTNWEGSLGVNQTPSQLSFSTSVMTVAGLSGVTQVVAGSWFGLALRGDGTVVGWGRNGFGQLGDTTNVDRYTYVQVVGVSGVTQIAATNVAGFGMRSDGTVMAWGGNWQGQQGDGQTTSGNVYTPKSVANVSTAKQIAAGTETTYVVLADGTACAWGNGTTGQLGNNSTTSSPEAVPVQGLTNVARISAGYALLKNGSVMSWGANDSGQAGTGSTGNPVLVPTRVSMSSLPSGRVITDLGQGMGANSKFLVTS